MSNEFSEKKNNRIFNIRILQAARPKQPHSKPLNGAWFSSETTLCGHRQGRGRIEFYPRSGRIAGRPQSNLFWSLRSRACLARRGPIMTRPIQGEFRRWPWPKETSANRHLQVAFWLYH